jgi:hypothetical protein
MKKNFLAIAALFAMSATALPALDVPCAGQTGNGQKAGARKGKKLGSQDGSGPIHTPGTGGGTGAGTRAGRR